MIETLNWCGGKSNLYSTSLNPFTGEREEERKEGGGAERVSAQRSGKGKAAGEGGREGQSLMGKSIVWLEKPEKKPFSPPRGGAAK